MTRSKALEIALLEIGTKEVGSTNDNKYGVWFGFNKVAWCMIFVSFILDQIGHRLTGGGWAKGYASVPLFLENFKGKITHTPVVMDCVIYDWQNDGKVDHVGFFLGWVNQVEGTFLALEGNTSYVNQSNGGEVMVRLRNTKEVTAFIDPFNLPL